MNLRTIITSKKIGIGMVLFSGTIFCVVANEFVVKNNKKSKSVSCSVLRDQCFQHIAGIVEMIPVLIQRMAQVQLLDLQQMRLVLEGDSGSFFACANKQQLQQVLSTLEKFTHYLGEIDKNSAEHAQFIKSLPDLIKKGKK